MRSLISAFVVRLLESIISKLATSEVSLFWLVSVAEQAGLNLTLSDTPKTGFYHVADQLRSISSEPHCEKLATATSSATQTSS